MGDVAASLGEGAPDELTLELQRGLPDLFFEPGLNWRSADAGHGARLPISIRISNLSGKMLDSDIAIFGENDAPLDDVLQLSNVARPAVTKQLRHRLLLEARHGAA